LNSNVAGSPFKDSIPVNPENENSQVRKFSKMASGRFPVSVVSVLKQMILLGGRHWWLSFLLWIVLVGPAQAATELRVAIKEGVSRVQVGSSTKAIVRDAAGQEVGELEAMNAFNAQGGSGVALGRWRSSQLWIEPTGDGFVWIGDRWYRGRTQLVPTSKGTDCCQSRQLRTISLQRSRL
jgi:stage II sporulation protein D